MYVSPDDVSQKKVFIALAINNNTFTKVLGLILKANCHKTMSSGIFSSFECYLVNLFRHEKEFCLINHSHENSIYF